MTEADILNSKILIVDDEQDNVLILKEILRREGFKNLDCESEPRNVLEREHANHYDLVLLDLQMPFLDGFEVMELLGAYKDNEASIIILTANSEPETKHSALAKGAKDFITKPFDHKEVICRIRNVLDTRLLQKALTEQNTRLEKSCLSRTEELIETRMHAIQCLGKAAEYRDNETGMHVVRMSKASARIAKELGWDDQQCDLILHASPMHDIGKIGIPDHILLKPGELDIDEWEVMQSHTSIGVKILSISDSDLFKAAAEIAATHHEKWDGSGYPEGLIGEEIPIRSRIVAVSDTFDALISERPYKKPWPIEEAISYVTENSGNHFDPEVVEAFSNCIEDILAISESFSDKPEQDQKKSFFPEIDTFELDQAGGMS